ncbi:MAG: DUF2600 family protein [Patulibacter sp.]|nr:DUF2600 family protein [Patulibacter sp.]
MTRTVRALQIRRADLLSGPAPWSPRQLTALGVAVGQQLGGGLRRVSDDVARWQLRAQLIPDPVLRQGALVALHEKRSYVNGAALFATVAAGDGRPAVQRLLVTFQVMANYLDTVSERTIAAATESGHLMRAVVDAVDPASPVSDRYYAGLAHHDDGGYLAELVADCRRDCAALPRYAAARDLLVREAERVRALEIAHDPDASRRDARLRAFAQDEYGASDDLEWFEHAAGAASAMTVIVLLALAGRPPDQGALPGDADRELMAAAAAYRWTAALSTMLDSYVDRAEDLASGDWSMVGYYASPEAAPARIAMVIERSMREVRRLREGERHAVIVGAMIAMFLSRDSARDRELRDCSRDLARSGGALTRTLVPALRTWRTAYRLRAL